MVPNGRVKWSDVLVVSRNIEFQCIKHETALLFRHAPSDLENCENLVTPFGLENAPKLFVVQGHLRVLCFFLRLGIVSTWQPQIAQTRLTYLS